jgi:uncharacterized protein DUF6538
MAATYLQRVGDIYRVQVVVPAALRPLIGRQSLTKGLGTGDYDTARQRSRPYIAEFKAVIANARLRLHLGKGKKGLHVGGFANPQDGKHYWRTPPDIYESLNA